MAPLPVHYRVRIVGHAPPFKWEAQRAVTEDTSKYTTWSTVSRGEANSYLEAKRSALEAADEAEWTRQHGATEVFEHLFTVRPPEPIEVPDSLPDWLTE